MPTYVYKFTDTGETIEVFQAFTDDALTEAVHPTTGATMQVKKVFLPVGVTFKGGGFYKTDSRGRRAANATAAPDKAPAESSSGSSDASTTATAPPAPSPPSTNGREKPAKKSATVHPETSARPARTAPR